ncbi:carbonic anhydrase 6 [Arapaima gigas]
MGPISVSVHILMVTLAGAGIHWTYKDGELDQMHWADKYPFCGGRSQSPIDIQRRNVRHNPHMPPLELTGFDQQKGEFLMTNNGHSVQIDLPPTMMITKGLPARYTAVQMHLHWGGWDLEASGAEHTLDGIRYMAELHVVHYNSEKYKTFADAVDKPDGLAVLAFFYEDGHFENTYYSDFISNLAKVKYAGQSMNISTINVRAMLPENLSQFYRYQGSLTTPPCYESILWTVFDTTITLSHNQIRKLEHTLMDLENKTLWNDYRIAQPLNERVVESSFLPRLGKGTFCRQEEIEGKLLRIEGLLTNLGKKINSGKPNCGQAGTPFTNLLVLQFAERKTENYALVHNSHTMKLQAFTACMHVHTEPGGVHTVLSYLSSANDNELMISVGFEVGVWIGNAFVSFPLDLQSTEWVNYCLTWASHSGGVELFINGIVGQEQYLKSGYIVHPGGTFILGKDQDGFLGISDTDAFVGYMTDVNVWDYVLTNSEILQQMSCSNNTVQGNVFAWGVTELSLYGGVRLGANHRCS